MISFFRYKYCMGLLWLNKQLQPFDLQLSLFTYREVELTNTLLIAYLWPVAYVQ